MGSETRIKKIIIRIRVSPAEKQAIQTLASACDLSVPAFMRAVALGFTPKTTIDAQHRMNLAKIQGDLGRIGGLLKLWLSTDAKKQTAFQFEIPALIDELKQTRRLIIAEYDSLLS